MTIDLMERKYLLEIVHDQMKRYTHFAVVDMYKLVHQAVFGPAHLIDNETKARNLLWEEWETLEKVRKGESLLEMIDPKGEIIRVNLRVYKKIGGSKHHLFDIMMRSAGKVPKDDSRFIDYWREIEGMAHRGEIPFEREELNDLLIEKGRLEFPPAHHSKQYVETNQPAYRLVLKQLWEGFKTGQNTQ